MTGLSLKVSFWFMADNHSFIPLLYKKRPYAVPPSLGTIILEASEANILSGGYGMLCPVTVQSPLGPSERRVGPMVHFKSWTEPPPDVSEWLVAVAYDEEIMLYLKSLYLTDEGAAELFQDFFMKDFV